MASISGVILQTLNYMTDYIRLKSFWLTYFSDFFFFSYVQDIPAGSTALIKLNISPLHQRVRAYMKGRGSNSSRVLWFYGSFIKKAPPFLNACLSFSLHCISRFIFHSQQKLCFCYAVSLKQRSRWAWWNSRKTLLLDHGLERQLRKPARKEDVHSTPSCVC